MLQEYILDIPQVKVAGHSIPSYIVRISDNSCYVPVICQGKVSEVSVLNISGMLSVPCYEKNTLGLKDRKRSPEPEAERCDVDRSCIRVRTPGLELLIPT